MINFNKFCAYVFLSLLVQSSVGYCQEATNVRPISRYDQVQKIRRAYLGITRVRSTASKKLQDDLELSSKRQEPLSENVEDAISFLEEKLKAISNLFPGTALTEDDRIHAESIKEAIAESIAENMKRYSKNMEDAFNAVLHQNNRGLLGGVRILWSHSLEKYFLNTRKNSEGIWLTATPLVVPDSYQGQFLSFEVFQSLSQTSYYVEVIRKAIPSQMLQKLYSLLTLENELAKVQEEYTRKNHSLSFYQGHERMGERAQALGNEVTVLQGKIFQMKPMLKKAQEKGAYAVIDADEIGEELFYKNIPFERGH